MWFNLFMKILMITVTALATVLSSVATEAKREGWKLSDADSEHGNPFRQPHYILLNLAIGGGWGGQKGIDDTIFPCRYEIDYVRVYQKK